MSLAEILVASGSSDQNIRVAAENALKAAEATNFVAYLHSLATELANAQSNPAIRQLAGIIFKNSLHAKDETQREAYHNRWLSIDAAVRLQIKQLVTQSLMFPSRDVWNAASMALAKIVSIEITRNEWPNIIQELRSGVNHESVDFRQACLQSMGFICEEMENSTVTIPEGDVNAMLTAICQTLNPQYDIPTRVVACNALLNALPYIEANFSRENERAVLMNPLLEAAESQNLQLKEVALSCLVTATYQYYEHMSSFIQRIFAVTVPAIQSENDEVALQGIELWSTIAEVESELNEEGSTCQNYTRHGASTVIPLLLQKMTQQSEDLDEEWNPAMATATCLNYFAIFLGNDIIPFVLPFVQGGIANTDWHAREAALMAFGTILEGTNETIRPIIQQAFPSLGTLANDANEVVRDTCVWVIGRICEFHPAAIPDSHLEALINLIISKFTDSSHVAFNACYAVLSLADSLVDEPSKIAPFIRNTITALIGVTNRADADENHLRPTAFEAINSLINACDEDNTIVAEQLTPYIMEKLREAISVDNKGTSERSHQQVLQGSLCGVLGTLTQKLDERIAQYADQLMTLYLQAFASRNASIDEEALMAIGHLCNAIKGNFAAYLPHFIDCLCACLSNYDEYTVCSAAVGVLSDLTRTVESQLVPFMDRIMGILIEGLRNPLLNRDTKLNIISTFGDIAMGISQSYTPYLQVSVAMILEALRTELDMENPDEADYVYALRENCYEAFSGILQGYRDSGVDNLTFFVDDLVRALTAHAADANKPDSLLRNIVSLVGDMYDVLQNRMANRIPSQVAHAIFTQAQSSDDEEIVKVGVWARSKFAAVNPL